MKRQENRAVIAWRGAASTGLVSSADRAYMKAPAPHPTLRLVDKVFDTMKTAKIIRDARIRKNMTQMNLADAMSVSYQAVSNWERGVSQS